VILSIRASVLADDFAPLASDDGVAPAPFCASSGEFTAAANNIPIPATTAQDTIQSCFFIFTPPIARDRFISGNTNSNGLLWALVLGTIAQHHLFPNARLPQHLAGIAL
jgi:hypothetical protein